MAERSQRKGKKKMDLSLLVMCGIVVALVVVAYLIQGWPMVLSGLRLSANMLVTPVLVGLVTPPIMSAFSQLFKVRIPG